MRSQLFLVAMLASGHLATTDRANALDIIPPNQVGLLIEGQHASGAPFSFRQVGDSLWDMTVHGGPRAGITRWEQVERSPAFLVLRGTDSPDLAPFYYRVFPDGRAEVNMTGSWVPNGVVRLTLLGP